MEQLHKTQHVKRRDAGMPTRAMVPESAGRFRRAIQSTGADLFASIADYDDLLVSLTGRVATAYVLIRTFEERLAIARENVAIRIWQKSLDDQRGKERVYPT